ncbi:MAG TPA: hypothetical protein VMZ91_08315 [Candidatus Paceibacterota bacterium]|nr:hypothetical protein [Candidatus Paceibacterota bacterium]
METIQVKATYLINKEKLKNEGYKVVLGNEILTYLPRRRKIIKTPTAIHVYKNKGKYENIFLCSIEKIKNYYYVEFEKENLKKVEIVLNLALS